ANAEEGNARSERHRPGRVHRLAVRLHGDPGVPRVRRLPTASPTVTKTADEIVAAYTARRKGQSKSMTAAESVKSVYNGDHLLPLPELERAERASVANLLQAGIDQHALRIASVLPGIQCPPLKPTKAGIKAADDRRLALQAWWYENKIPRKLRRRARHLVGYGTTPVLVRPGKDG